jgi:hypothetical protein
LEISDKARANFGIDYCGGASAEINRDHSHGFVHGHEEVSGSKDAAFAAQSFIECLTKYDAYVLHRVVLIDIEIATGLELQIEAAMMGE